MTEAEEIPLIVLFDGECNFCCSSVNFIISHDPAKKFRFASLQSEFAQSLLFRKGIYKNTDSLILVRKGAVYFKSQAVLEITLYLNKLYPLGYIFNIIPLFIRNRMYDFFAKNRYNWFGKKESCMIPAPGIKESFLEL